MRPQTNIRFTDDADLAVLHGLLNNAIDESEEALQETAMRDDEEAIQWHEARLVQAFRLRDKIVNARRRLGEVAATQEP